MDFYFPKEFKLKYITPKSFELNKVVNFDFENNNSFQYNHITDKTMTVFFIFNNPITYIFLKDPDNKNQILTQNREMPNVFEVTLSKKGIYYFEFYNYNMPYVGEWNFSTVIPGQVIESIDLNKPNYYKNLKLNRKTKIEPLLYELNNLKENKYVYFSYDHKFKSNQYGNIEINENSPFEVCNKNTNKCSNNVKSYEFLKDNSYVIKIHFFYNKERNEYYFTSFSFFPISNSIIEKKEKGYYTCLEPKIYIINFGITRNCIYLMKMNKKFYFHH